MSEALERSASSFRGGWLCLVAAGWIAGAAHATSVVDFSVEDLTRWSHAAARVEVLERQVLSETWLRYELELLDVVYGALASGVLEIDLLRTVDGMPHLEPGEELLLFFNFDNDVEKIVGLQWGALRIRDEAVFDYRGTPLELRIESRGSAERTFLRPARHKSDRSIAYGALRDSVTRLRRTLAARGIPAVSAPHRKPQLRTGGRGNR